MKRTYFSSFLIIIGAGLLVAACNTGNTVSDNPTEIPETVPQSEVTATSTETPNPTEEATKLPKETATSEMTATSIATDEAVSETAEPDETEDPNATPEVAQTPETATDVDLENPLPNITEDRAFFVAPSRAAVDSSVAIKDPPEGFRWIVATVTLANQSDSTEIAIEETDISLIAQDARRYTPQDMAERVNPALVGSVLPAGESVMGFALFALPDDVEPVLFEWCPTHDCGEAKLQAQIPFQE